MLVVGRYEDDLLNLLDKAVRECEDKVAKEKRRHAEGISVMIDQDRLCETCGMKYKLRFADVNVRETEGGRFKPDIHPECELHKAWVKLRERRFEFDKIVRDRPPDKDRSRSRSADRGRRRSAKKCTEIDSKQANVTLKHSASINLINQFVLT